MKPNPELLRIAAARIDACAMDLRAEAKWSDYHAKENILAADIYAEAAAHCRELAEEAEAALGYRKAGDP